MARELLQTLTNTEDTPEISPKCAVFGVCGGCKLQHLTPETQREKKEGLLLNIFSDYLGEENVPETLPTFTADPWHYRSRLRFSARLVPKKGGVLVGFREKKRGYVTEMTECHIVPRRVSDLIQPLRHLVGMLSTPKSIPQIDVADAPPRLALIIRHLETLTPDDLDKLEQFEKSQNVLIYLQPKGLDTIHQLGKERIPLADDLPLSYELSEFGITLHFHPICFTQINTEINAQMVKEAVKLLEIKPGERIVDMFCGIGNFSLPLAKQGAQVLGFEWSKEQIEIAGKNAALNQLQGQTTFIDCNLEEWTGEDWEKHLPIQKMLLDPPRSGAEAIVSTLPQDKGPQMIAYVSCDPLTLARDAKILTEVKGYRFKNYRMLDMFPHTFHMETLALFEKGTE